MKKTSFSVTILALALVIKLGTSQTPPAVVQNAGVIQGIMTRAGTPEPIPGVMVQLNIAQAARSAGLTPDRTVLDTTTDEMGHFEFRNLVAGTYQLRYQLDGYFPATEEIKSNVAVGSIGGSAGLRGAGRGRVQTLAFALDVKQPVALAIPMIPGGVISGRISDSDGRPIVSGQVSAMVLTYTDGQRTLGNIKSAMTNDRGEYRLFGLEPGEYYVRNEYRRSSPTGISQDAFHTYYPGVHTANDASTVTVRGGTESSGTNITIRPAITVKVSGTVILPPSLTPPATPLNGPGALPVPLVGAATAVFYLEPLDSVVIRDDFVVLSNNLTATADRAAGKFEIRNVIPGRYDLYTAVRTNPANPQERHVGHAAIIVGNQDLDGVHIDISPGVDLRARVTSKDPAAASQAPVQLTLRIRSAIPAGLLQLASTGARGAQANDSWRTFPALPEGQYVLDSPLALLRDAYVADIRQGDKSIYETGTVIVGSSNAEDVEVILARPAATITGTVQNAAGKPAANSSVALIPNGDRRQNPMLYKRATSGTDGNFSLGALAPGAYKLFAWEALPNGAELNADFLKQYEERGLPVAIDAGMQLKTVLSLIPDEKQ
jgi:5-hydroxyisourate hydrolase-like protein (transthyretin family)